MRKILLAVLLGSAVVAAVPTVAMATTHRHRNHHNRRDRHARVHHEHFGSWNDEASAPSNTPNAGTIASFDNRVLTIRLADGSMVSGQVTNNTEIRCEAGDAGEMENREHADGDHGGGNDNRGGDDNGRGDDEQGEEMCSTADLVPGAGVSDAELTISGAGAVWSEVDLAG